MGTNRLLATVVVFLSLLFTIQSWRNWKKDLGDLNTQVVQTYSVPPARAEELRGVLTRLFWQKDAENPIGSAQVFGNGTLIVKAPLGYQTGVADLISKLGTETGALIHDFHERVRLDYWLVMGEANSKSNSDSFGELSPVLASIDKIDGPRRYRTLEHLGSTTTVGTESDIRGSLAEVKSVDRKTADDQNLLDFQVRAHNLGEVTTKTVLKTGEFVVLGQNSMRTDPDTIKQLHGSADWAANPPNVYHVIRITSQ